MTSGDIFWVEFPARGGRAQSGRRPAIVFQIESKLPTILLVPLTSQPDALRFPGTVLIEPSRNNGLLQPSVALVFQLAAVDRAFIKSQIGSITSAKLGELWLAFDELAGRPTNS